ncbi:hypothetical protein [Sinorhizobium alkalisoli]|nr:hypothetical protein [Sinorhizobium alkalisoli]
MFHAFSDSIRGGLTVGKVYSDRDVVFGPAMIRAYDIEHTMATNPIMMID